MVFFIRHIIDNNCDIHNFDNNYYCHDKNNNSDDQ